MSSGFVIYTQLLRYKGVGVHSLTVVCCVTAERMTCYGVPWYWNEDLRQCCAMAVQ